MGFVGVADSYHVQLEAHQHVIHCLFGVYTTKRIIMDIDDDRIKDIPYEKRDDLNCPA